MLKTDDFKLGHNAYAHEVQACFWKSPLMCKDFCNVLGQLRRHVFLNEKQLGKVDEAQSSLMPWLFWPKSAIIQSVETSIAQHLLFHRHSNPYALSSRPSPSFISWQTSHH